MNDFNRAVRQVQGYDLRSATVRTIQVNLGLACNLSCRHCHVEAAPGRGENMNWETMCSVLRLAAALPNARIDLTGGAPELNPFFRRFIAALADAGHQVQVRTNLAVFFEEGQQDTPEFLAGHAVQLVASLPCYLDGNVDAQRGSGVYELSVAALRRLNALGYGRRPELPLNLVYNPGGAFLPPDQSTLEEAYRRELKTRFDIDFTRLLTITNMPIGRFLDDLRLAGRADRYVGLLVDNFNGATLEGLMCRHQVCVAWDGTLSDCDFNSVIGLGIDGAGQVHIDRVDPAVLAGRRILTGGHCFACTAGSGSSCGGALVV